MPGLALETYPDVEELTVGRPYARVRWYSHRGVLVTLEGLKKTIGGKRGGSTGVGTGDGRGVADPDN